MALGARLNRGHSQALGKVAAPDEELYQISMYHTSPHPTRTANEIDRWADDCQYHSEVYVRYMMPQLLPCYAMGCLSLLKTFCA